MNAPDPHFAARIRESFARQKAMALIGASLARVEAGEVEIALPWRDDLTQQKGFVHGGVIGMIADTACGYSAFSLMPAGGSLVTVEYKVDILKPGYCARRRHGPALRLGRPLTGVRAGGDDAAGRHV